MITEVGRDVNGAGRVVNENWKEDGKMLKSGARLARMGCGCPQLAGA